MKIYVLRADKVIRYVFASIVLIITAAIIIGLWNEGELQVFNPERKLPIYSVEYAEKAAAITFDCAWGADDIPQILDVLDRESVKATFFIVGRWAEKFPDTVRLIAQKGHDIANHSYSHLRMGSIGKDRITTDISKCGSLLENLAGKTVDLFRPPYGDYNNAVVEAAENLGYYTIQWDVDSLDWKPDISQEQILKRVTAKVQKGSIILFHNDTPHTAEVLAPVITALKNEGYKLLPVSKIIMRENYTINFEGRQKSVK